MERKTLLEDSLASYLNVGAIRLRHTPTPYAYAIRLHSSAGILEQSRGARNRVGIRLSYRPARLHRLAESYPLNRLLGSIKV
jgi:hypothetical protein